MQCYRNIHSAQSKSKVVKGSRQMNCVCEKRSKADQEINFLLERREKFPKCS